MIVDDDILFFSKAEDFIAPESLASDGPSQGGRESERLPNSVGGYKVGELLGKGGFAEVRLGEHQLTGEKVALKFLRKAEIHSLGAAERTNTEIQCLATLKHMNIIKMIQVSGQFLFIGGTSCGADTSFSIISAFGNSQPRHSDL